MDASYELIKYYKKLVSNSSSVIIGGNLTPEEQYLAVSTSKVSLSDIMYIAEPKYYGNYNNKENKNNSEYIKQYKIYCDRINYEGKEPVTFDIFLNTTIPLKDEIDNNRKKHLTPLFEKLNNFFKSTKK